MVVLYTGGNVSRMGVCFVPETSSGQAVPPRNDVFAALIFFCLQEKVPACSFAFVFLCGSGNDDDCGA